MKTKTSKTSASINDESLSTVKAILEKEGHDAIMRQANKARHNIGQEHEKKVDSLLLMWGIATRKSKFVHEWGFAVPDGIFEMPNGKTYWFESTTNLKNPQTLLAKKRYVGQVYPNIQFVLIYNPTQKKQVNVNKTIRQFKRDGWIICLGAQETKKIAQSIAEEYFNLMGETTVSYKKAISIFELRRSETTYVDWRKIKYHPSNRINKEQEVMKIVKSMVDLRIVGGFFSAIIVVPETKNGKLTGKYICVDGHTRLKAIKIAFETYDRRFETKILSDGTLIGEYDIPIIVVDWITSENTDAMNDLLKKINTTIKTWGIFDFVRNGTTGYEKGSTLQRTYQNYFNTYKFSRELGIGGEAALVEMVGDKDPQNGWLNRDGLKHGTIPTLTTKEFKNKIVPFGNTIAKPLHTFLYENLIMVDTRAYRKLGAFLYESVKRTNDFTYADTFLQFMTTSVNLLEIPRNLQEVPDFIDKIRKSLVTSGLVTKELDSKL